MKIFLSALIIALGSFTTITGCAQEDHSIHDAMAQTDMQATVPLVHGEVKKVDKTAGTVTLAHDAIPNLEMPAMTMSFKVEDAGWLERMQPGDHIRFSAENVDGEFTVTHFEPDE
ncbi:MAG: copper-binding protein [Gammaproteobacteria bacterium]|nr:MAG: copper-binding protein [Gammaproteobacteria bacterium]